MTESERRSYNEGVASVWRAIAKVTPRTGDYTLLFNAVHGMKKYPNGFNVKIDLMSESETHYEYANIDGSAIVVDTQKEIFPECYGNQCPLYKYEVGRGFICTQAETMGGVAEEDE